MMLLKNCHLIPELTEGFELPEADVLIEGNKIAGIFPCGLADAEGAEVLDLKGKTLMPGLIDAHVHLRMIGKGLTSDGSKPCSVALDEYIFARWLLDNGYTCARDVGDNVSQPAAALRDHINSGKLTGPRLFCSGPTLIPTEVGTDTPFSIPNHYNVDSPLDMRRYARLMLQQGSDFIKIYGTASMTAKKGVPAGRIMMEDEIRAAVEIASLKGTYCAIHSHGNECCDLAARLGVRTIEHASYIEEDTLKYLEGTAKYGQGIVITASVLKDDSWGTIPAYAFDKTVEHLSLVKDYDVLVGLGTDTSLEFYRKDPYCEFRLHHDVLGFSNIDVLKHATINNAILMMQDELIGTVKTGKLADLIVVDGDPAADLSVMYRKPEHVIMDGVLIR